MLDEFKNQVMKRAGSVLGSKAALAVMSNPQFQQALRSAINLRSDVREGWEGQVEGLARSLNLVTRQDIRGLKRTIRELENQLAAVEYELKKQKAQEEAARARAEAAEKQAADAVAAAEAARAAEAKAAPAKKTTAARKPAAAKKTTTARKPAAAKKTTAARKPAAAKKTTAARKPAAAKKASPAKKTTTTAAKKTTARKKPTASKS